MAKIRNVQMRNMKDLLSDLNIDKRLEAIDEHRAWLEKVVGPMIIEKHEQVDGSFKEAMDDIVKVKTIDGMLGTLHGVLKEITESAARVEATAEGEAATDPVDPPMDGGPAKEVNHG